MSPMIDTCRSPDQELQIALLFDNQADFLPPPEYHLLLSNAPHHATSRNQSVSWIVRVAVHHGFSQATAVLAVNYLDRFLASHGFPGRGWAFHLLSLACLSLAAKMEELHVPLLDELQVLHPERLFHPRTVQRMELCVLGTLKWRMKAITAFDFLFFFVPEHSDSVFEDASGLLFRSLNVIELLAFPPSIVAAGAILVARSGNGNGNAGPFLHKRVDLTALRCCKEMLEKSRVDTASDSSACDSDAFSSCGNDEPLVKRRRSL